MARPALLFALVLVWSSGADAKVSFNREIRPILSEHCFSCHGFDAKHRKADLRLDTREGALADNDGVRAIIPGDPAKSELWKRLLSQDAEEVMPPPEAHKPKLTAKQLATLRTWIEEGAPYEPHWAFTTPTRPALMEKGPAAIDALIDQGLKEAGLTASPEASPEKLLRRLSLDLTGLPPTPAELAAFTQARSKDPQAAYDQAVERLLASPAYGERWGRWWLDQARYADSNGYSIDAPRSVWKYRDWVVNSLNADLPFDRFTIEQLAGDLLPDAGEAQRIATGFHRNTPLNQEGGIDVEQFRIDSVFDRVATTGTVWLGLTVGCAQCHDHKFDPITQKEFFRMFAFFNNQDEPTMKVTDPTRDEAQLAAAVLCAACPGHTVVAPPREPRCGARRRSRRGQDATALCIRAEQSRVSKSIAGSTDASVARRLELGAEPDGAVLLAGGRWAGCYTPPAGGARSTAGQHPSAAQGARTIQRPAGTAEVRAEEAAGTPA